MAIPVEEARWETISSAQDHAGVRQRSGVFKTVFAEHGQAFAQVKRLGMRSDVRRNAAVQPDANAYFSRRDEHGEMVEGYAALRALVKAERLLENEAGPSDLADAMAALDAINPGSPEWGPTFLQVSELVKAHLHEAGDGSMVEGEPRTFSDW